MKPYIDTSALVKLYYPEPESAQVSEWILAHGAPILFTALHRLELTNALALKVHRGETTAAAVREWQDTVRSDLRAGVLASAAPDWSAVWERATGIAGEFTQRLGSRSLDVLHVATALELACTTLLTNDARQAQLSRLLEIESVLVSTL